MTPGAHTITLAEAVEHTRTGDVWLFRGGTGADRAIQLATNAPVNHVAMAVVLDDLPPLMWHAELGRRLVDVWTGTRHRGAQLHDLRAAVERWARDQHQRVWLRQLSPEVGREAENALLRTIARWNGASFPSTATLAWRWVSGRTGGLPTPDLSRLDLPKLDLSKLSVSDRSRAEKAEVAYCAELAAVSFEAMGVLEPSRPANWYDPGRFWSGDHLPMNDGWTLSNEIEVQVD
jgi:hypothetical protein